MVKLLMSNCVVNSLIVLLSFCQLIESYSSSGSEYSKGNKNVEGLSSGSSGLKEKSRRQVSISPASRSSIITSKFDNKGSSPSASSLRFPRSDPNYVRNFLYTSRGGALDDNNGWDNGRQLNSLSSLNSLNSLNNLQPSASSAVADYVFGGGEQDNVVAAGGHGHSSYGHGGGGHGGGGHGGGGHGHSSSGYGKDCNSALGLLGVLGLASYLQMSSTAAPAPVGRKKRDAPSPSTEYAAFDLSTRILPYLLAIGEAQKHRLSFHCAYYPVCMANKIITRELASLAQPVCDQLSKSISQMMRDPDPKRKSLMLEAGKRGREGQPCEKLYKKCSRGPTSKQNSFSANLNPLFGLF